ncbi:MAG: CBS domain-containing protein [Gammaproteobacteria bacterium]|nr:MAG: CBS domain-containing protein [Gammaproteobacteria bacterium]
MQRDFDRVDSMDTIEVALKKMRHFENECMIVDKRHEDDEYGLLLLTDIARQVIGRDRAPERVNVYEVMVKPVVWVDPKMDIRYCAKLFEHMNLIRAPVIENDEVVGIVSLIDLVIRGLCR